MLPSILSECLIYRFAFWEKGKVQQGMRCNTGLYRHIAVFSSDQSQQAYSLGIALCQQQQALLTKTEAGYTVWLLLQSDASSGEQVNTSKSFVSQH